MDEQVAKGDNLRKVGDASGQRGSNFGELIERFADNFKLALDCRSQQQIACVIGVRFVGDEPADRVCAFPDIPKDERGSRCIDNLPSTVDVGPNVGIAQR
jgi:hypothetical protein